MGFRSKPRTRDIICDWIEPDDGCEPLTATVVTNLTLEECDQLSAMIAKGSGSTFQELFEAITDRVVAWNVTAIDRVSGEERPVAPPAEGGAKVFQAVDPLVASWIAFRLATIYRDDPEREGKPTPAGTTGEPAGDES